MLGVLGLSFAVGLGGTLAWRAALDADAPAIAAAAQEPAPHDGALHLSRFAAVRLTDQDGRVFTLDALSDRLLVMNFFFSGCSSVCPLQTAQLKRARDALEANADVRFLSVSITPDTDTPARLGAFAERHGIDHPLWRLAATDEAATAALMARLGVDVGGGRSLAPDPDQPDHRDTVFLFDRSGLLVQRYRGGPLDVERLVREVRQLAALTA